MIRWELTIYIYELATIQVIYWSGDIGTNMPAEIIVLWGLLWFAKLLDVQIIYIFGDSQTN